MYKILAQDHPGSVGKILQNLLSKVEELSLQLHLPQNLSILRAGSVYDMTYGSVNETSRADSLARRQGTLSAIRDLVKMHMDKQKDDQTTRLLFAASRGDTATMELMLDQGFDANSADYDNRTALMVASMKGNTNVVKLLLEKYHTDPNLADVHGSTALMEAVKNAREDTMELLLKYGAKLCAKESDSYMATVLCQTVMDGDILFLRRLLRANINVNAADYDKRTAAHIAAAEGNVAALKVLVEHGADLTLEDRWKNTHYDEAVRANAGTMLEYLKTLQFALPSMSPQGESTE
jgi:ankyrin repeat protein